MQYADKIQLTNRVINHFTSITKNSMKRINRPLRDLHYNHGGSKSPVYIIDDDNKASVCDDVTFMLLGCSVHRSQSLAELFMSRLSANT